MTDNINEEKAWDSTSKTEREVDHYKIVHKNGSVVGKAKTKKGATRSLDKHDNEYGGYAHSIKTVFKEDVDFDELMIVEDTEHKTHTVKATYSDKDDGIVRTQIHPADHTANKIAPSKIYVQNINVNAKDKHHAINKVGVHLRKKGFRVHSLSHQGLKEELMENNKYAPKKLKDIVEKPSKKTHEWKGNTEDEKAIVARYDFNTVHHPDRNGNGDDVFKGSNLKRAEKAVEPGEDEKKYDEWNNGSCGVKESMTITARVLRKRSE